MRLVADFHVHSKYARATSPRCDIDGLAEGAKIKGIDVIATGDFTHPTYFNEIRGSLKEDIEGLFQYKGIRYILSTEICVIYRNQEDKLKRMHHIVLSPSLEIAEQIIDRLSKFGSLIEDGRPMLRISSAHFAEELFSISNDVVIIPAHAWTPYFSIFGSIGGVDSIEEAFEDKADKIFAIESGLSSDPAMNWMLSKLDRISIVSNSDAHSLEKLGREANIFDLENLSYNSIVNAIKTRKGFAKTYEFYPEEGKYHYDGHRNCKVLLSPWDTKEKKGICPVCRKKLTIGVLHRVYDLADRKSSFKPENAVPFQHIVPLHTIISKTLKKPETSRGVVEEYGKLIRYFGNEFSVFEADSEKIRLATSVEIADSIIRVKEGKVNWVPGYDGVFGELVLGSSPVHGNKKTVDRSQKKLDDF